VPVTAVSPTPRHALLVLAGLSARYPLSVPARARVLPAPDEELIRPIEPRAEPNRLDQAKTPSRRVDPEAFAAAKPIVVIPREGPGKLEVARHQHSLLRERRVLLSRRSRSAKLVCASGRSQERLLLAVAREAVA
jgi:hypothetical protein